LPRFTILVRLHLLLLLGPAVAWSAARAQMPTDFRRPLGTPDAATAFVDSLPAYEPREKVPGVIRLWGHGSFKRPFVRRLVAFWTKGFNRFHPECQIEEHLYGTSSAIPALFLGVGDLALLGEEILTEAVDSFERVKHYPPFGIEVATGSVDVRNFDYAQMFFVHHDNPLAQLTVAQLDAIFGAEHRRGPANVRTWDQLALAGEWAGRPITPYGWRIDDSFGMYLESTLLAGSHRWNPALHEFAHVYRADGTIYDHGQQILDALANDRFGIAVSNVRYAGPLVKAIAVAPRADAPAVGVTAETLINRTYPFARVIPFFLDRPPGRPVDPKLREFLRYILSREGQQDIVHDGGYLPLSPEAIAAQLKRLE
jgi:phosphate transport system substrate-binding protein